MAFWVSFDSFLDNFLGKDRILWYFLVGISSLTHSDSHSRSELVRTLRTSSLEFSDLSRGSFPWNCATKLIRAFSDPVCDNNYKTVNNKFTHTRSLFSRWLSLLTRLLDSLVWRSRLTLLFDAIFRSLQSINLYYNYNNINNCKIFIKKNCSIKTYNLNYNLDKTIEDLSYKKIKLNLNNKKFCLGWN